MKQNKLKKFELIYDYKDYDDLRKSFNELSKEIFGIDFELFYKSGAWNDRYVCYSYVYKGKVVSNVSINKLDMIINNKKVKALQIGTVMTHPNFRGDGLAGKLTRYVLEKYEGLYQIIYLFANKSVLNFYPKYGFKSLKQSQFTWDIDIEINGNDNIKKLDVKNDKDLELIKRLAIERRALSTVLSVENAQHLLLFYFLYVFTESIYYIEELETIVIYEKGKGVIDIYDIVSPEAVDFERIVSIIATRNESKVIFHFTPTFKEIEIEKIPYDDSDDMLFVKSKKIYIPENIFQPITAHA